MCGGGTSGWAAVATTAAIGSALTIVFFTIPELARGEALLAERKTTFFGGDQADRVVEDAGRGLDGAGASSATTATSTSTSTSCTTTPHPRLTGPEAALTVMIVGQRHGERS